MKLKDLINEAIIMRLGGVSSGQPAKQKLEEQDMQPLRKAYYELGDKIENLEWVLKRFKPLRGDNVIERAYKQMKKIHGGLYKHLNKTYKGWD